MRLNIGSAVVSLRRKGLLGKEKVDKHTFSVELMLDDDTMEPEGALVVETETDKQWQLIAAQLLRK